MSNWRVPLRDAAAQIPYPLAKLMVRIPFQARLGKAYLCADRQIDQYRSASLRERQGLILCRLRQIVELAYSSTVFYRHWYDLHGFSPASLRSLAHFQDVPIVTKKDLRNFELEQRTANLRGALRINTGGTSGEPLEFYVDRDAFAREWAHMHRIWKAAGYVQTDLKLTLRGKHLGEEAIRYNVVHNEYVANAYVDLGAITEALRALPRSRSICWLHGYPSLVAEFVSYLESHEPALLEQLRQSIKGVLLGSEFPAPHYRRVVEEALTGNVVSWYGHSEMAVIAGERTLGRYEPFQTYGYCEAVPAESGHQCLVGTSYWNSASPFIRYNTGDLVDADSSEPVLRSFEMKEGRVGDFVERANGSRIALTALIFGRHHPAFEMINHIQVRQDKPGQVTFIVVPKLGFDDARDAIAAGFLIGDVGLNIGFEFVAEPVRTPRGKAPLLVTELLLAPTPRVGV